MRKAGPILILLIGSLALAHRLLARAPASRLDRAPTAPWRPVETKLGLDLEGGLRVEYQALPGRGQVADARRHGRHQGHRRAPGEHRPASPSRSSRPRAPTASSSSCRASPIPKPSARLVGPDRPARLRAARARPRSHGGPDARPQAPTRRCSAATRSRRRRSAPTRTAARPSTSCSRTTAPNLFARLHRARTSAATSRSPSTARSISAPVIQNSIPNGQRPDHGRRARPASRRRTPRTS